jgi:hypothetical protein
MHFIKRKEEKNKRNDNLTIIHHHVPHHEEKDTIALPKTWQKVMFGHLVTLHASSKWRDHHPLTGPQREHVSSFLKQKIKKQTWKYQNALTLLVAGKKPYENIKILPNANLIFYLFQCQ